MSPAGSLRMRLWQFSEGPDHWRRLCPSLSIDDDRPLIPASAGESDASGAAARAAAELSRDGFTQLSGVCSGQVCDALRSGIEALESSGMPPLFVYGFDEPWLALAGLHPVLLAVLGDHVILEDLWAWRIPLGGDHGGWAPHRGWGEPMFGQDGRPRVINIWIAVSDVAADNACMHLVPRGLDPCYPSNLSCVAVHDAAAVVALPARRGTALLWDANTLHWGGRSAAADSGCTPRVAYSFTAAAVGTFTHDWRTLPPGRLSFRLRMEAIARQVLKYGSKATVDEDVVRWAEHMVTLSSLNAAR